MQLSMISRLIACALGIAAIAGCATPSSSQTAASTRGNLAGGKIANIETDAAAIQSTESSSSGSSASGTKTASGGPAIITVRFDNGTERRYISERHSPKSFSVGDPVYVVSNTAGDRMAIVPVSKK